MHRSWSPAHVWGTPHLPLVHVPPQQSRPLSQVAPLSHAGSEHGERADVAAAELLARQVEGGVARVGAGRRVDVDRAHPDRLAAYVACTLRVKVSVRAAAGEVRPEVAARRDRVDRRVEVQVVVVARRGQVVAARRVETTESVETLGRPATRRADDVELRVEDRRRRGRLFAGEVVRVAEREDDRFAVRREERPPGVVRGVVIDLPARSRTSWSSRLKSITVSVCAPTPASGSGASV